MRNVSAIFALLLFCSLTKVTAHGSGNNFKPDFNKEILALNFISSLSFTPASVNPTIIPVSTGTENVEKFAVAESGIEQISPVQFKYSMMMNVNVETLTDASLYNFIDDWSGTRYRMGGSSKRGIDCSAFTSTLLMAVYSLSIPRTAREQYAATKRVAKDDLTEGDLVFFNTTGGVSHVGLYLSNGYFVHSCCSEGVTINNLDDSYYSRRFLSGGRPNQ